MSVVQPAMATEDVIYKSGKTPEKFKNKNKDDKTGTKKESKFLRCLSNCRASAGPRTGWLPWIAIDCKTSAVKATNSAASNCTRSNEMWQSSA